MGSTSHRPLFIDTSAFYARFVENDHYHESARRVFREIQTGDAPFGRLFTSRYILTELVGLMLRQGLSHAEISEALSAIRGSRSFTILPVGEHIFSVACRQFHSYDDQRISLVDHLTACLASEYDINDIFSFDSDFETLGLTTVPRQWTSRLPQ
ncbi:type II toxin-antitoxin system VapC family toxin [Halegenticoccus tardaugens]|uniref:type II toxin-antitoxin system VapC family toxin n=1 Tax=Halegenticoccus tardaugens TaxID=2071624 RepID=UPI00100B27F2|nr:PIN domain-containing protein [Halegenticoccus tardaugens]